MAPAMTDAAASGQWERSASTPRTAAERSVAESLAGGVEKLVERTAELVENAVGLTGRVEEVANKVAVAAANAVGGLLGGSSSSEGGRSPPADAPPVVPPAVPAPATPVPAGGPSSPSGTSFSGGSSFSGHDHDLPLEELAVLVLSSIALLQGGKLRPLSQVFRRPESALRPVLERPG
jgi:hypothetical protein